MLINCTRPFWTWCLSRPTDWGLKQPEWIQEQHGSSVGNRTVGGKRASEIIVTDACIFVSCPEENPPLPKKKRGGKLILTVLDCYSDMCPRNVRCDKRGGKQTRVWPTCLWSVVLAWREYPVAADCSIHYPRLKVITWRYDSLISVVAISFFFYSW